METKTEFQAWEKAWLAALAGSPSNQQARMRIRFNEERAAWGLKQIHKQH